MTCRVLFGQRRREENVAQQDGHAHAYRAPVVELIGGHTVEKEQPDHGQTGHVEYVEDDFLTSLLHSEFVNSIEHRTYRQDACDDGDTNVNDFGFFLNLSIIK